MSSMKRLAASVVAAGLVLTACASSQPTESETTRIAAAPRAAEQKAILVARQDPGTLDYTQSPQTALLLWIPGNVVQPLLSRSDDGEIGAGLADFSVDASRTTYEFTLKPGKFSDGSDITVDDVIYSLETMRKSPVANYAAAYAQVQSIEKEGEKVVVKLKQPSQAFIQGMASMAGLIQPEAQSSNIATAPVGSGPYQLDEYMPNSRMIFSLNPHYAGEEPALKVIEVRIIEDGAAVVNALQAGEADGMPLLGDDLMERIRSQKVDQTMTLYGKPANGERQYLVLNADGGSTREPKVRQAFAAALDRAQIIMGMNAEGNMIPTCDYGIGTDPWTAEESDETCPYPTSPEDAQRLAAEADIADGAIEFVTLSDVPFLSLPADVLVEQFKAAGIGIERNAIDLARYSQTIFQGRPPQFEVTNMSDPAGITQFACPDPAEAGWTTYCSEEFTSLIEKADQAATYSEYVDLLGQANEQLKSDAVIIPISYTQGLSLGHPALAGFDAPSAIMQEVPLHRMGWKDE